MIEGLRIVKLLCVNDSTCGVPRTYVVGYKVVKLIVVCVEVEDNMDNGLDKIILLSVNQIDLFYNCFVIGMFLKYHSKVTFLKYNKKNCFDGKYMGKKCTIYLFNQPKEYNSEGKYYVFQKKISNKMDFHLVKTDDLFSKEHGLFIDDPFYYMVNNIYQREKIIDWLKVVFDETKSNYNNATDFYLYKYKSIDLKNGADNKYVQKLINGELSFADPDTFNDPFDCDCHIPTGLRRYIWGQFYVKYDVYCKRKKHTLPDKNKYYLEYIQKIDSTNVREYDEYFMLLAEMFKKYVDDKMLSFILDEIKKDVIHFDNIKKIFRVLCMTKNPRDILMWGYYGNGGQGVAVEFDHKDIINALKKEENIIVIYGDVNYSNKIPSIKSVYNISSEDIMKYVIECIFTKFSGWSTEYEYRFVIIKTDVDYLEDYVSVPSKRNRVYLGVKNSDVIMKRGNLNNYTPYVSLQKGVDEYKLL